MREILGGRSWMLERCSVPGWRWRGLTLCLMKHPKTSPQGSFWAHPGGGMGGGEDRQVFNLSFVSPGGTASLCPCPLRHSILQQACFSLGAARQAQGLAFLFLPGNFGSVSCCHPLGIPCGWWHSPWPPFWAGSPEPPGGAQSCGAHLPRLTCTLKCHPGTAARGTWPG